MSASGGKYQWLRGNAFLLGLIAAVVLAFVFPGPGARGGILQPEILTNGGIALILFLQGLSLAMDQVKAGAANWRLHLTIQAFTFVVFPLLGLLFHILTPVVWTDQPEAIRSGFLFLCVLPSTISTSVVLTAVAHGNVAGALFNAALSNIVGVFFTPLLVHLLMRRTGHTGDLGPLLLKVMLLTLVPFFCGMLLRPRARHLVDRNKPWLARISNAVILFIVYTAFCDSVANRIWDLYGAAVTVKTLAWVVALFCLVSVMVYLTCVWMKMERTDSIAAYFCSVKKTLAMGVPLAALIFGNRDELPLILLPIMFYHPLQLLVNGWLANRWAREGASGPVWT